MNIHAQTTTKKVHILNGCDGYARVTLARDNEQGTRESQVLRDGGAGQCMSQTNIRNYTCMCKNIKIPAALLIFSAQDDIVQE